MIDAFLPPVLAAHAVFLAAHSADRRASARSLAEALQEAFKLETSDACDVTIAWLKVTGR